MFRKFSQTIVKGFEIAAHVVTLPEMSHCNLIATPNNRERSFVIWLCQNAPEMIYKQPSPAWLANIRLT